MVSVSWHQQRQQDAFARENEDVLPELAPAGTGVYHKTDRIKFHSHLSVRGSIINSLGAPFGRVLSGCLCKISLSLSHAKVLKKSEHILSYILHVLCCYKSKTNARSQRYGCVILLMQN